ncbi:hypothetical protein EV359DRAFT_68468 [Lentinula novae-zelandiae]|nr:hypothetical protein EV359DRAFT_68468 [Lentinula novae-zelandiae]
MVQMTTGQKAPPLPHFRLAVHRLQPWSMIFEIHLSIFDPKTQVKHISCMLSPNQRLIAEYAKFIMAKNAWNSAQRNTLVNIVFLRKVLPSTVVELKLSASHSFWTNDSPTNVHTIDIIFTLLQRFTNVKILTIPRGMGCMLCNCGKEQLFGRHIECYSGPACFIPYIASKTTHLSLVVEDFHVNLSPWDTAYVQTMMEQLSSVKRLTLQWDWLPTNTAILYEVVIKNCMHLHNLLHLTLSPLTSINEQYLMRIRENCPTITSVIVDNERWIYTDHWHPGS